MRSHKIREYRNWAEYREWTIQAINNIDPNWFLTFNFNPPRCRSPDTSSALLKGWEVQPEDACRKLKDFFNHLQTETVNRGWCHNPRHQRPQAYGFLEHPTTNFHYHVLVNLSPKLAGGLRKQGLNIWNNLCPGGQLFMLKVRDLIPLAQYVTKDLRSDDAVDAMFTYSDPNRT